MKKHEITRLKKSRNAYKQMYERLKRENNDILKYKTYYYISMVFIGIFIYLIGILCSRL